MRSSGLLGILARVMLSIGCASSQISSIPISAKPTHKVQAIAMAPGGGLLADAVAVELANRGLTVIDPSLTSNLLVRLNLTEIEVARPEGLAKHRDHGIDAYLVVRSAAGADGRPESASARMNSTYTGQVLAGVRTLAGRVAPTVEGTPPGGPRAPRRANRRLDERDQAREQRGHRFARAADEANLNAALGLTARRKPPDMQQAAVKLMTEVPYEAACEWFEELTGLPLRAHTAHEVAQAVAAGLTVLDVSLSQEDTAAKIAAVAAG
jgi:hypothetical protein